MDAGSYGAGAGAPVVEKMPEGGVVVECCPGFFVPYPTEGADTRCWGCGAVFTVTEGPTQEPLPLTSGAGR